MLQALCHAWVALLANARPEMWVVLRMKFVHHLLQRLPFDGHGKQ